MWAGGNQTAAVKPPIPHAMPHASDPLASSLVVRIGSPSPTTLRHHTMRSTTAPINAANQPTSVWRGTCDHPSARTTTAQRMCAMKPGG